MTNSYAGIWCGHCRLPTNHVTDSAIPSLTASDSEESQVALISDDSSVCSSIDIDDQRCLLPDLQALASASSGLRERRQDFSQGDRDSESYKVDYSSLIPST